MTKQERDELRRLCSEATPGQWHIAPMNMVAGCYLYGPLTPRHKEPVPEGLLRAVAPLVVCFEDASFIAAARTALPALLDDVDALYACLDRAAEAVGHARTETAELASLYAKLRQNHEAVDAYLARLAQERASMLSHLDGNLRSN